MKKKWGWIYSLDLEHLTSKGGGAGWSDFIHLGLCFNIRLTHWPWRRHVGLELQAWISDHLHLILKKKGKPKPKREKTKSLFLDIFSDEPIAAFFPPKFPVMTAFNLTTWWNLIPLIMTTNFRVSSQGVIYIRRWEQTPPEWFKQWVTWWWTMSLSSLMMDNVLVLPAD